MRSLVEDSSKIEDGSRVFLCSNEAFRGRDCGLVTYICSLLV